MPQINLGKIDQLTFEAKLAGIILTVLVVIGIFFGLISEIALAATNDDYYPNAEPSAWYILPGQMLGFTGTGFAPLEKIYITDENNGAVTTEFADASGNLNAPNLFAVPYNWQNTVRNFSVVGAESDWSIPIKITVGTFYPQITPSRWWLRRGQTLTVFGKYFAPNETVRLYENGQAIAKTTSTNSGTVTFTISAPTIGSKASLRAEGQSSDTSSARTIFLY